MLNLTRDQYLELEKLAVGAFAPLTGFMGEADFKACVATGRLANGEVFPIPIVFDVDASEKARFTSGQPVDLGYEGEKVGRIHPESFYRPDKAAAVKQVFGTDDSSHPGVQYYGTLKENFVGGRVELSKRIRFEFSDHELTPAEAKQEFAKRGWKKIVGFQTRNAPHRAHEYLQKVALEVTDGILIHPLVGKKKAGDYTPEAVLAGYQALVRDYFPPNKAMLAVLSTVMRYAGPREAAFHALVRRNYGCTHFIIGRDHAGVGGFYSKYAGHEYVERLGNFGIEILKLHGPFYCRRCASTATEQTCPHFEGAPGEIEEISGTLMRRMIEGGQVVDERYMRKEVVEAIRKVDRVFI